MWIGDGYSGDGRYVQSTIDNIEMVQYISETGYKVTEPSINSTNSERRNIVGLRTLLNKNKGGGGPNQQTESAKQLIGNKQKGTKKPTVSNKLKGQKITWDLGTSTAVLQFDKQGKFISEYKSMGEAYSKTGAPSSSICEVCKGRRKSAHKFIWKYKE